MKLENLVYDLISRPRRGREGVELRERTKEITRERETDGEKGSKRGEREERETQREIKA